MTNDRRFLSHACLEPKVERNQDGLHLIIRNRNKTFLGLVFSPTVRLDSQTVSYEEIFPGNFGVGGVKKFLGKKTRFLRGNFPAKFPRPKFPQEILTRILLAEEILKPKIYWRQLENLRGNFGIT